MKLKITYNNLDSAFNAFSMFNLRQQFMESVVEGKCRQARTQQKELAKMAVEDFDAYKTLPNIRFENMPIGLGLFLFFKTLKYRIFKAFTRKSPEEKQLNRQIKAYLRERASEAKKAKTIDKLI